MKKLSLLFSAAIMFFAISCNESETDEEKLKEELKAELKEEMQKETDNETVNEAENTGKSSQNKEKSGLEILKFNKQEAAKLPHKGDIVYGKSWMDNNGKNMLIMSENIDYVSDRIGHNDSRDIHAYHYAKSGAEYKLIREIKDFEQDCEGFNLARFMERSLEVTDLDSDGYAEMTFAYRLGCGGGLRGGYEKDDIGLKLMMLENGDKYAIRGTINSKETNIDPSFDTAPKSFLPHAKQIWNRQQNLKLTQNPRLYKLEKLMKFKNARFGGVEPNWSIKLYDNYLEFKPNMGESPLRFDYRWIRDDLDEHNMITVHTKKGDKSGPLFQITKKSCSDGMSEKKYPLKAYVSYDQKSYTGCGSY